MKTSKRKRYRMQRLNKDILTLDLNDLVSEDLSVESTSMLIRLDTEAEPQRIQGDGQPCHQLTESQVRFLKDSLKNFPDVIKEMNI